MADLTGRPLVAGQEFKMDLMTILIVLGIIVAVLLIIYLIKRAL